MDLLELKLQEPPAPTIGTPGHHTTGPPIGHVLSTPSMEDGDTDYSNDGARDLTGRYPHFKSQH